MAHESIPEFADKKEKDEARYLLKAEAVLKELVTKAR